MLTIAVLGPVEVRRDGERLRLPSGKTTEVLVRLALDAGRLVRTEALLEDIWADAAGAGRNTLQVKISQLRRALGDPALIVGSVNGYTLAVDPEAVDAMRAVRLAGRASMESARGDASRTLEIATAALSLFRGEPLTGAGEGSWLEPHRTRLEEVRLGLLEEELAARVALGTGGDLIGRLKVLVGQHPLRERLWGTLITALYRVGRQADALAAYRRVRATLVEQLAVEPGPALQALEAEVLRHDPGLDSAGAVSLAGMRGNLPALSSPLVGREADLTELAGLVRSRRLVTIVGPAGVGKTRTAIEVCRTLEPPGGVWLVRLDTAGAAVPADQVVAETLQVPGGPRQLVERFTGAVSVLLLDNCEHVVDAVADLVGELLDGAPALRVLATSQLPLAVDGERVHPLLPLPLADAVALFAARAADIRVQFRQGTASAVVVEEVCRALDGLPLAIELAAARVRSLSVEEIARRLDDRFTLLRDPTSRGPERRRALAAAIGWSHDLLFPDDQRGLWALACFAGGAALAPAEQVMGALGVPVTAALDVVARLVDRSLVSADVTDGAVRYRLLDSIRALALDRLADSGLADAAHAAHAAWFAAAAERCRATVRGAAQPECVAIVRAERANIDAALAWCADHDPLLGLRIANGFGWTWVVLGDGVAGSARLHAALEAVGPDHGLAHERADALVIAGWLEASAGNVERAAFDLDGAQAIADELDDARLRADVARTLAFLAIQQGRPDAALRAAMTSLATYRSLGLDWEVAASLVLAAFASITMGKTAAATESATEGLAVIEALGDSWGTVHAQAMLGSVADAEGRFADAVRAFGRAAVAAERLGFLGQVALHLTRLGRAEERAGHDTAATTTLERAVDAAARSGDPRMAATARTAGARILRRRGQPARARGLLEQSDRWYRESGGGDGALLTRCLLAGIDADTAGLEAVLAEAWDTGDLEVQVLASDALARIAAECGDDTLARQRLASADALMPAIRHLLDERDRVDAGQARTLLGRETAAPAGRRVKAAPRPAPVGACRRGPAARP